MTRAFLNVERSASGRRWKARLEDGRLAEAIAASGDLAKAKARVADFETAWDDAAETMRPLNPTAWGNVDEAADKALSALRSDVPEKDEVNGTLTGLLAAIDDPNSGTDGPGAGPVVVNGIAVSDANGRYLPCETMLTTLRSALSDSKLPDAEKAAASTLQAKATERCNADDDQHADELSAQAITALGK